MILRPSTVLRFGKAIKRQWNSHSVCVRPLSAFVQNDQQIVVINDDRQTTDSSLQFPAIWLRDNCLCSQCFHKPSRSRVPMHWNNFDCEVTVENIRSVAANTAVHINWSDKHESEFTLEWLKERNFSKQHQEKYLLNWYRPQPCHWGKEQFATMLKKFEYQDVMHNDQALKEWLESIAVQGVSMLKHAPLDVGTTKAICNRVGFIRKTTYGEEFSVKSRPNAKNYSYLAQPLPLHTDMPYFEYKPSVTILHTLEQSQSKGGWNVLSDGFYIADILKEKYPDYFKILTETMVNWFDIGRDENRVFHNIFRAPVINIDRDGKYTRINHSVPQRDSHFTVDINRVAAWYRANATFVRLANEEITEFKTETGDVLSFNNLRMLHGRTGYDDTPDNVRHIVGGFVDWDIVYSKLRVLKQDN